MVSNFSVTKCPGIRVMSPVRKAATLFWRLEPNVSSRLITLLLWYLFNIIWLGCTCSAVPIKLGRFIVFLFLMPVLSVVTEIRPLRLKLLSLCILLMAMTWLPVLYRVSNVPVRAAPFMLALLATSMVVSPSISLSSIET